MNVKIVKVTSKGQISLPINIREAAGIEDGDQLMIINEGEDIVLKKLRDWEFQDYLKMCEPTFKKIWDNKYDDRWDKL